MPKLVLCAGEASGDLIGARALESYLATRRVLTSGIGGPNLRALGVDTWFDCSELSVRGYVETLRHLPRILKVRREFLRRVVAERPNIYFGIDAPDFNLGVAQQLRQRGICTVQLVSPAIWAWRSGRLSKILESIDHMLCIFPFETSIFEKTRVKGIFVGHPLANSIPFKPSTEQYRSLLGIQSKQPVMAILPGSRDSEIHALGETFLQVAINLSRDFQCVIPAVNYLVEKKVRQCEFWPKAEASGVMLLSQRDAGVPVSHLVMGAADFGLVASGTAALEMALFGRPHVIAYRVPWLTYKIMKSRSHVNFIGLPNIILGEPLVPELIQEECNVDLLTSQLRKLSVDESKLKWTEERFSTLHSLLRRDTSSIVANYLESLISDGRHAFG